MLVASLSRHRSLPRLAYLIARASTLHVYIAITIAIAIAIAIVVAIATATAGHHHPDLPCQRHRQRATRLPCRSELDLPRLRGICSL